MKNIVYRESYIKSIKKSIGSNLIKIITGIRGAGKSTILSEIIKYVHSKNDESYVISMDFSLKPFSDIKNEIQLFEYLQSRIKNKKDKYYLFLDEIQNVKNFENIILHFYSGYNVEIFITGSSSYLLSKQIGTKFTRRHIDFEIFPFTFLELKEYCLINNISLNDQELLEKMIMFGGLPLTYQIPDDLKIK
jgi:predicted AAA+ superfamily ATPase